MLNMRSLQAWAKFDNTEEGTRWHSLIGHSADVAAVFEALVDIPANAARLDAMAGRPLGAVDHERLAALALLHDLGKANWGFQAKALEFDERRRLLGTGATAGHVREVAGLFAETIQHRTLASLPIEAMGRWFADDVAFTNAFLVVLSHHGKPITCAEFEKPSRDHVQFWEPRGGYNPFAELARLAQHARAEFPGAFDTVDQPLPDRPRFWHAVAGLLQLADWIGSHKNWFRFADGADENRLGFAREQAQEALRAIGLVHPQTVTDVNARQFQDLFRDARGRALSPRDIQSAAGKFETAPITLIEAETGSGKTEAALWRFARLHAAGKVDALYFALPTRVSATQMYDRVKATAERLFGPDAPPVVLAIPGQARVDGLPLDALPAHLLPLAQTQTTDEPDDPLSARRWAAERPKRFLAAPVAVGTVDQALLSALRVKHAHLRHACLMRSLLVIDEVHASDTYMTALTDQLLANHLASGGHALLMSATLGSAARARLLSPGKRQPPSTLGEAETLAYPMFWNGTEPAPQPSVGAAKHISITQMPHIADPAAVAALAAEHCAAGAKVLVIRNTVALAQDTQTAIEQALGADHPALFRCESTVSLHHGRFARADRQLLDQAVEAAIGKRQPQGARAIVGTQTLEQSLDIDADLLITDLCPIDVLLQRIGRLHRHHERARPTGYETARALVLVPTERELIASCGQYGLGPFKIREGRAGIYENLFAIEATWRLIETHEQWRIPEMNRMLVERATHPEAIEVLHGELAARDPRWEEIYQHLLGSGFAQRAIADAHGIDMGQPFAELAFPDDEAVLTRLGASDRVVRVPGAPTGPFGQRLEEINIPGHWALAKSLEPESEAEVVSAGPGQLVLEISGHRIVYDRFGLRFGD
jgi:CRISPR-associated endonuclease/helicase Cas3